MPIALRLLVLLMVLALAALGCEFDPERNEARPVGAASRTNAVSGEAAPEGVVRYERDPGEVSNPERGWYVESDERTYEEMAADGPRLAMRYVRLDRFRNSDLSEAFLRELERDFTSARGSGLKLVVRFAYNRERGGADAPLDVVLRHVDQLSDTLHEYGDVISAVQAGFIGAWGEWHSSTNDLLRPDARSAIAHALLDAVPETRMVQFRYPEHVRAMFPDLPERAHSSGAGSGVAGRIGMMNDCFVSSPSDGGTYDSEADRVFSREVTRTAVMGGETCAIAGVTRRSDCEVALRELGAFHYDYLNREFYEQVLRKWRRQGCFAEVSRRLGYRFELVQADVPDAVVVGEVFTAEVDIANTGFGKLYNPRPLDLLWIPQQGGEAARVRIADDARTLLPAPGEQNTIRLGEAVPSEVEPGAYALHLALPDPSPHLASDARYAVRMANVGTWDATSGTNDLLVRVEVTE